MIAKETVTQDNLIDGTVYIMQPHEGGAYVTVAGRDGQVAILSFDIQDLKYLAGAIRLVDNFDPSKPSDDQARVTPIGAERIGEMLANGGIA